MTSGPQNVPPRISPGLAQTMRQALALHKQGRLDEAERLYREVIAAAPHLADAWHFIGLVETQRGRDTAALEWIGRALALDPKNAAAYYNRANSLQRLGRPEDALADYERALALQPRHLAALNNRGILLEKLRRPMEALASYDRALAIDADRTDTLSNRGNLLLSLKRPQEALAACERALALNPRQAGTLNNRGNALRDLKRPDEALASYDAALALQPDFTTAQVNRANALRDLKRFDEALGAYDRALAVAPDDADGWNGRGLALVDLQRYEPAANSFERALSLRPDFAEALYGYGYALLQLKRHDESIAVHEKLLLLKPDHPYSAGMLLHAKRTACDWKGLEKITETVRAGIRAGRRVTTPYAFIPLSDSEDDNFRCARILVEDKYKPSATPLWRGERYRHERIRLGYFSADFRQHPVSSAIAGIFELHDKQRFETFAFSFGLGDGSAMRARLQTAFDRFLDVTGKTEAEIAGLARSLEIDIAIDLTGFTGEARPGIFSRRPAPVQVNYLGYPATMAAPYYDYIFADAQVIPLERQRHYAEQVVYLPDTYMPADRKRPVAARKPTREQAGLPESGFVFCSFNNSYKLSPAVFDVWMRLLHGVEGSVLWLASANPGALRNLAREAEARGIAAKRLIFAPFVAAQEAHLARLQRADLFLDTWPCNAHTTASDALWAGVPVVTLSGQTFAGRVAGSLLHAIGLPELIADSVPAYEDMALRLARDPAALAALKSRLRENRATHPLFDTARHCRHLERAYTVMCERIQQGAPPRSFAVTQTA